MFLRLLFSCALKTSKVRNSTTSVGNLFQGLTVLVVKYGLIMSSQNTVVILTSRPQYIEEAVVHARANLNRLMPALCHVYGLALGSR